MSVYVHTLLARDKDMCQIIKAYEESGKTSVTTSSRIANKNFRNIERRFSTGTLNRLILVAQALESEVELHRKTDISGSRVVVVLRTVNLVILFLINGLIVTGVGQYYSNHGGKRSLMLTPDKWYYSIHSKLPQAFVEMRLPGQYFACGASLTILLITTSLQAIQLYYSKYSRLLCMCYSFSTVPFSLFIFGLEMHYSTCPWIEDFYRIEVLRKDFNDIDSYFDTQCGISGWALAGIFSLISCSLFIGEGLVSAFFRSDTRKHRLDNGDALL